MKRLFPYGMSLREARRELREASLAYPKHLEKLAEAGWPPRDADQRPAEVWRSKHLLVQVFAPEHGAMRVTVNRTELADAHRWKDGLTWEDLMQVKSEIGRADYWAVEIYPARASIVDVANMRHLWLLENPPPFAWQVDSKPSL